MLIKYLKDPATPKELKYKVSEEFDKRLGPILQGMSAEQRLSVGHFKQKEFAEELERRLLPILS